MIDTIISVALRFRLVVIALVLVLIAGGAWAVSTINVDAFPDLTPNQVQVITVSPGLSPNEVENLVSYPMETAMMGLPRTSGVRAISKAGISVITVSYDDDLGCKGSDQVTVNVLCSPMISEIVVEPAYDCVNPEGSLTVSASTNDDCNLLYSLDGVNYQQSSIFNNLAAGDYTVYVKTPDGCEVQEDVYIDGNEPAFFISAPDYIYLCTDELAYIYFEVNQPIVDININGTAGYTPPQYLSDSSFAESVMLRVSVIRRQIAWSAIARSLAPAPS